MRMRSIFSAANSVLPAPTQMIWLPGAYHLARDFEQEGFALAVSRRRTPIDLRFVDLEMRHLNDHEALERLRDIAESVGITERSAFGIVSDLAAAGYIVKEKGGRRNRYRVEADLPLPESVDRHLVIGDLRGGQLGYLGDPALLVLQCLHASSCVSGPGPGP